MKIHLKLDKKNYILCGIMAAFAILFYLWNPYPPIMIPGFVIAYAAIRMVQVELKRPFYEIAGTVWGVALMIAGPWFSVWCMQNTILEKELIDKMSKSTWRWNMYCILVVYLLMLAVFARVRWAWIAAHSFFLLVGLADYFVYEFRENEIAWEDLTTVGTGLSVASQYKFKMAPRCAVIFLLSILAIALVRKFKFRINSKLWVKIAIRIAIRVLAVILAVNTANYVWSHIKTKTTQTWEKKGSYRNGFVVNFLLGRRDSQVTAPNGYSEEEIAKLEAQYPSAKKGDPAIVKATGGKKPTIITIMDESFADFRLIGNLQTSEPLTPFMDSMIENTTRGFAMSSVFGAKTPNSEWEYLTGNSMAFMPGGSVVYQQFLDKQPTSLVSTLKNQGYTAIAMHPYFSTGWRRSTVYPWIGFDEMHFMDDGYFDETKLMREYITDQEMFDKIIARFEEKDENEPLFIMGVTMQNHGGYKETEWDNFETYIHQTGVLGNYPDADLYLTLVHETDKAVENLITYFESVDEPVEIIFFGDHYPSLSSGFVRSLNGKGLSNLTLSQLQDLFSVPFFVWTNYDTPEEEIDRISLNYLSTIALERSGLDMPPYNQFLEDLREVIPAINIRGYYSVSDKKYLHNNEAHGEERTWMYKYRYLQYNDMFDEEHQSQIFFPYILEEEQ